MLYCRKSMLYRFECASGERACPFDGWMDRFESDSACARCAGERPFARLSRTPSRLHPRVRGGNRAQRRNRIARGGVRHPRQFDGLARRRRAQSFGRARPRGRLGGGGDGAPCGVSAIYLRAQEGLDPRGADQRLVPDGRGRSDRRRGHPPAVRSGACGSADDDLGRGGGHSRQRRDRPAVRARAGTRHQRPRRRTSTWPPTRRSPQRWSSPAS